MKKQAFYIILCLLLVSSHLFFFDGVKAQKSTELSVPSTVAQVGTAINWTEFWLKFRQYSYWSLECDRREEWEDANEYLTIERNYTKPNACKVTLIFDAPVTADYRLNFAINIHAKQYFHKEGSWNYTLTYDDYIITFDWNDVKNIPNLILTHGVSEESWFWFRIRRNNVQKDTHIEIDPVTVATSTSVSATYYQQQRKTFYANSLYWLFYTNGSHLVYHTSSDALSWSSLTVVRACNRGNYFDVGYFPDYNTTNVYYAYSPAGTMLYRRGVINGASITWASEVTVYSGITLINPSIAILTDGRIIIVASFASGGNTYCYAFANGNNDGSGSWDTPQLFTFSAGLDEWLSCVVPLTDGKAYALYAKSNPIYGRRWAAGSWWTEETPTSCGNPHFSATSEGDDVHLAYFTTTAFTKGYRLRDYSEGVPWQAEEIIHTAASVFVGITICVNVTSGDLYTFFGERQAGSPFYYQVLYSEKPNASSWSSATILASNEPDLKYLSINAFKRVWNDIIGVVWTRGEVSPYDVRYSTLSTLAKQWNDIATWIFNLTTREWLSVSTWNFNLSTMQWNDIVAWTFNLTTMTWYDVAQWTFTLVTSGWHTITIWIFTLGIVRTVFPFILIIMAIFLLLCLSITTRSKEQKA